MANPTVSAIESLVEGLLSLLEFAGQSFIKNAAHAASFARITNVVNSVLPVAHSVIDKITGTPATTTTTTTTTGPTA